MAHEPLRIFSGACRVTEFLFLLLSGMPGFCSLWFSQSLVKTEAGSSQQAWHDLNCPRLIAFFCLIINTLGQESAFLLTPLGIGSILGPLAWPPAEGGASMYNVPPH